MRSQRAYNRTVNKQAADAMRTDRFALSTAGLLAGTLMLAQAGCAGTGMSTAQSPAVPAVEIACSDTPAAELADDARSYTLPDSGGKLWLVPCIRGAYQTSYNAVWAPADGAPRRLLFAQWRNDSWTGTADLFDPEFDAESGVLSDRYKDRGIGDCGGARRWHWDGYDFRLVEYRARSECNGSAAPFPVIFEAPAQP